MKSRAFACLLVVAAARAVPAAAQAQAIDPVATPPPNVVLANYDSVPVGPFGGLEGSAYVTRVSDPSAAWFNPAGLSRQSRAQISGSGGAYQWTAVSPKVLPHTGSAVQQLPNFVGFTMHLSEGLTAGAVLLTTNSWTQEVDSQLITAGPTGQERVAYSADSQFTRRVAAIGAGYDPGGPWRVGGGIAFSLADLRLVQGISDRVADGTALNTLLVSARGTGNAVQLRAQAGVQYDTARFRFGGAIRTPGLTLHREGTVVLDGVADHGPTSVGASLFDSDAFFQYRLPWELHGGAAYVRDRLEVELDVQGYTAIAAHTLLGTDQPTVIYGNTAGGVPTVIARPFGGLTSLSNGVVNVAVGGHVRPMRRRDFRIHGGYATSHSPAGSEDQVFNNVDLSSWTVGASGGWTKLQLAIGINWRTGTAADVLVRNVLNGDPLHTTVDVRTAGLIYSIAYQF